MNKRNDQRHELLRPVFIAFGLAVLQPAGAAEITLTNPQALGLPVDKCLVEGQSRCSGNSLEIVADAACRANGHTDAVNGTVAHRGDWPRDVARFNLQNNRFQGPDLGADTVSTVICNTADPNLELVSPEDNAAVTLGTAAAINPAFQSLTQRLNFGIDTQRFQLLVPAVRLEWRGTALRTDHRVVGCLQASDTFDNARFECGGIPWALAGTARLQPITTAQLQPSIGSTVFWSVRACQPSPRGTINSPGGRLICSNWVQPRRLRIVEPEPGAPAVTFADDFLQTNLSERCRLCHLALAVNNNWPQGAGERPQELMAKHDGRWPITTVACGTCHERNRIGLSAIQRFLEDQGEQFDGPVEWRGPDSIAKRDEIVFDDSTPDSILCERARDGIPGVHPGREHLKKDPFVLWAVGTPRVPHPDFSTSQARYVQSADGGYDPVDAGDEAPQSGDLTQADESRLRDRLLVWQALVDAWDAQEPSAPCE